MRKKKAPVIPETELIESISSLIEKSKMQATVQLNSALTLLFWQVGNRINDFTLKNKRAEYGGQIIVTLSRHLTERYGRNFEEKNLRRMLQFASIYPESDIVVSLSRQLSWSHFLVLIPIKDEKKRTFYTQQVIKEQLGVRALRTQIEQKGFE